MQSFHLFGNWSGMGREAYASLVAETFEHETVKLCKEVSPLCLDASGQLARFSGGQWD